ncbi:hypothetical protein [Burkholderia sp. ABCPW 14]|uniref:hypothetical protein n=1 Tax=Burkholderia sp. ABCPW 14 TaxID=1637860 RepID=UPI000AA780DD|nr:hypothetical protein [Burkholderia sp. ABCPW 14]
MKALTSYDQATLINLPGRTDSVAILAHTIVPRVLDLLEHVARPGPYWQTGSIARDVGRNAQISGIRWGNLYRSANGDWHVRLLPFDCDERVGGVARADVLVAISAGEKALAAGSSILFLRLDREGPDAVPCCTTQAVQHDVAQVTTVSGSAPNATRDAETTKADLHATWKLLEE